MTIELNVDQISNRINWVNDLLSGEFKQGHGRLKQIDLYGEVKYCCLGVPCERLQLSDITLHDDGNTSKSQGYLSEDSQSLLGLTRDDQTIAAKWNDDQHLLFSDIADLIAWSTVRRLAFSQIDRQDVPKGYARAWRESE